MARKPSNFCAAVCDVPLGPNFDAVDGVTEVINRLEVSLDRAHKEGGEAHSDFQVLPVDCQVQKEFMAYETLLYDTAKLPSATLRSIGRKS